MSNTPLKKIIKSKLKSNKSLTPLEKIREELKYEIADELGLREKIDKHGWSILTSEETGRIGGIMNRKKKEKNLPKNKDIINKFL